MVEGDVVAAGADQMSPQSVHQTSRSEVEANYDIQDERALTMLDASPDAVDLLGEIAIRAPRYFPEIVSLAIRGLDDPEDGSLSWYVVLQTPLDAADATARLRRFDHDWWLDAKPDVTPELVFTIELV